MAKKPKKPPTEHIGTTAKIDGAVEFIDQNKGTLPEALTPRDLETLNAALRFFFADLRVASGLFQRSEGYGRAGVIKALGAMWRLIALFQQPLAGNLHVPLLRLQDALMALDDNEVAPMLKPLPRSGRARSTGARAALRGYAAATVERLMQAGLSKGQACARVAKTLTQLGVRAERGRAQITADTIRHWCDEVSADVGRTGEAAIVRDGLITPEERDRFARLASDQPRQRLALTSLVDFIAAALPELLGGQKPT